MVTPGPSDKLEFMCSNGAVDMSPFFDKLGIVGNLAQEDYVISLEVIEDSNTIKYKRASFKGQEWTSVSIGAGISFDPDSKIVSGIVTERDKSYVMRL